MPCAHACFMYPVGRRTMLAALLLAPNLSAAVSVNTTSSGSLTTAYGREQQASKIMLTKTPSASSTISLER